LTLFVVGKVIVLLSKVPFITPITMKPFMFVIEAVKTTLLRPAIGDPIEIVGVENT
jgi:hypothetical protein